jgi:hypothetical protein
MVDLVYLDNSDPVDGAEVEMVKRLVCSLYGDSDPRVEIEGAFFGNRRYPHTVYMSESNRFYVAICIPKHQADDPLARIAHLSHELVHCLNPNGIPPSATVLEEGLAEHSKVYLSHGIFKDYYPDCDFRDLCGAGRYRMAFELIEELVHHEGLQGMRDGICAIRARTKLPFGQITQGDLAKEFVLSPQTLLAELSKLFED